MECGVEGVGLRLEHGICMINVFLVPSLGRVIVSFPAAY